MPSALRAHLTELVAEARLRSQDPDAPNGETILRQLVDSLPVAALVANNEGRYVFVNRVASKLTGHSKREIRALSVWDLTPAHKEHDAEVLWRAFLQQREQIGEYILLAHDGSLVNVVYAARAHILPGLHLSLMSPEALRSDPPATDRSSGTKAPDDRRGSP